MPVERAVVVSEIVNRINEDTRRIRLLEQRSEKIENRLRELEDNVSSQLGDLKISLERISNKISSISEKLAATESETLKMNKALEKTVSKAEVKQLETFIDVLNPVTSRFVTKEEMERMLEERLKKA